MTMDHPAYVCHFGSVDITAKKVKAIATATASALIDAGYFLYYGLAALILHDIVRYNVCILHDSRKV